MHAQAISAPTDSGADPSDVDIAVNAIGYAGLHNQPRQDRYSIRSALDPQSENQLSGDLRLKYLDPIVEVAKLHIPTFLNRPQCLLFSIYGTDGPFLMPCSLLHLEDRNREKEER